MRKKILTVILLAGLFYLMFPAALTVEAAGIQFSPTTVTTTANQTFTVTTNINVGSDQVLSTDAYITYDGSVIEAQSVAAGTFFPIVTPNITTGRVYIAGMVSDSASPKTGSGTLATITFKGLKDGSATISVDCSASKIVKNDANGTNLIICSDNNSSAVTVGAGSSGGTNDGTTTGGSSGTTAPTQLPRTGAFEDLAKLSQWGVVLVILGGVVRLLLL